MPVKESVEVLNLRQDCENHETIQENQSLHDDIDQEETMNVNERDNIFNAMSAECKRMRECYRSR